MLLNLKEMGSGARLYLLGVMVVIGFLGMISGIILLQMIWGKTLESNPLLMMLMGSMSTNFGIVIGYYFGSSKSSADKTTLLSTGNKGTSE